MHAIACRAERPPNPDSRPQDLRIFIAVAELLFRRSIRVLRKVLKQTKGFLAG